ncbi:MAG: CDP-alcohol phosphatidyltransferase family protein [Alphaproteobacteria bacterium]|nr:CDP-alcohol phosphatidyltransferase family protein [Alphaproteobacteria bacterium]
MKAHNLPNLITVGRTFLVPVVFWLVLEGRDGAAFVLFVIAGLSDGLDGYLARRFDWRTELGAYLDPLADKLLLVSIFVALGMRGDVPSWLVIVVVARDIMILMAVILSWMLHKPVEIDPLLVSKVNTAAQIALAALVLADQAFSLGWGSGRDVMIWLTAALTVGSLLAYLRNWIAHMTA